VNINQISLENTRNNFCVKREYHINQVISGQLQQDILEEAEWSAKKLLNFSR